MMSDAQKTPAAVGAAESGVQAQSKANSYDRNNTTNGDQVQPYQRHIPDSDSIPVELRELPIWCCWKLVQKPGKSKPDKVPVSAVDGSAAWSKPGFCTTLDRAIQYATDRGRLQGVGLILSREHGLAGGDLDGHRDPATDMPTLEALAIINRADTYTEVSPGLAGYRFIARGTFGGHTGNDKARGVEFYEDGRFLTITGWHVEDTPFCVEERDLTDLGAQHFERKEPGSNDGEGVPEFERVDLSQFQVPRHVRGWITDGVPDGEDRSTYMYGAAKDLLCAGATREQAICVLADPENRISEGALERRAGDLASAMQWIGTYCVDPALAKVDTDPAEQETTVVEIPVGDDGTPDLSHDQLALDLSANGWSQNARYVQAWGRWLFWDGTRWGTDDRLRHMSRVREHLRRTASALIRWGERQAAQALDPKDGEKVRAWARKEAQTLRQAPTRANVEATARSNPDLVAVADDFDANVDLLGTPGGTVDLRTGELRHASREDYITRLTAVAPAAPGARAPLWESVLFKSQRDDPEMVAFLQRLCGYALTGYTTEHKLPFVFGPGGTSKSTFMNTVARIMDEYGKRAPAETFLEQRGERHPTDLAGLRGARLVVGSELPAGRAWNETVIKDLTGGDTITARFMRQDFFEYDPQFTLVIYGNHQPSVRNVDAAMRRRILLIPFDVEIPAAERDPELPAKLEDEWPAILRWMIDGAVEWYRQGLNPPQSVIDASDEYLDSEDLLGEFLAECTTEDPDAFLLNRDMYARFRDWCQDRGLHSPWSQHALTRALKERRYPVKRRTNGQGILGLRLSDAAASYSKMSRGW